MNTSFAYFPFSFHLTFSPFAVDRILPVVIYLHGGGWTISSAFSYRGFTAFFARHNHISISIDYRLAPEHAFPIPLHDCYDAYLYIRSIITSLGFAFVCVCQFDVERGDLKRVMIAGDSAGGNLAAALAILLRDQNQTQPNAQILISPVIS
jgi:acetyl esterase